MERRRGSERGAACINIAPTGLSEWFSRATNVSKVFREKAPDGPTSLPVTVVRACQCITVSSSFVPIH